MFEFLKKITAPIFKTKTFLGSKIRAIFGKGVAPETLSELEQTLYEADLGSECISLLMKQVRSFLQKNPSPPPDQLIEFLSEQMFLILSKPLTEPKETKSLSLPHVVLIVGVNGSGKTTTIAKLAHQFQKEGKKVLLIAGDTFRAAAVEQLSIWASRLGIDIIKGQTGGDPAAVIFDGLSAAKARGAEVVLIDTAGRLQNKTDLMHELQKIRKVSSKVIDGAPHETLLVVDASTGQNGVDQAKTFHEFAPLTGIVITKIDGSTRGGIAVAIYQALSIPIRWVCSGEGLEDLTPFEPKSYIEDLLR